MKKYGVPILLFLLGLLFLAGCSTAIDQEAKGKEAAGEAITLTVSAAASLADSLEEIREIYRAKKEHIDILYNFGSSGSLQQQIEQGAPVDLFISAGKKQMASLVDAGLMVEDSVKDILENKVSLIAPLNGKEIKSIEDLVSDDIEKIAIGEPGSVPVGQYTEEVLKNLGIFERVQPKLVFAKDAREVLYWVETGNVDIGFVYETDAQITHQVKTILTAPEGSHTPVIYPLGIVKSSRNREAVQDFMDFLFTEEARQVFVKYGFSPGF